ncbi:MAG: class I SAM-dependent methyltransferase [Halofilum sp. (in: g-proteobacteria)]|nr:class I SAM-dependent methyltransferase [Halofilum sp. (in: g-proteobacteria)]
MTLDSYRYLAESIPARHPDQPSLAASMEAAGLTRCTWTT